MINRKSLSEQIVVHINLFIWHHVYYVRINRFDIILVSDTI